MLCILTSVYMAWVCSGIVENDENHKKYFFQHAHERLMLGSHSNMLRIRRSLVKFLEIFEYPLDLFAYPLDLFAYPPWAQVPQVEKPWLRRTNLVSPRCYMKMYLYLNPLVMNKLLNPKTCFWLLTLTKGNLLKLTCVGKNSAKTFL